MRAHRSGRSWWWYPQQQKEPPTTTTRRSRRRRRDDNRPDADADAVTTTTVCDDASDATTKAHKLVATVTRFVPILLTAGLYWLWVEAFYIVLFCYIYRNEIHHLVQSAAARRRRALPSQRNRHHHHHHDPLHPECCSSHHHHQTDNDTMSVACSDTSDSGTFVYDDDDDDDTCSTCNSSSEQGQAILHVLRSCLRRHQTRSPAAAVGAPEAEEQRRVAFTKVQEVRQFSPKDPPSPAMGGQRQQVHLKQEDWKSFWKEEYRSEQEQEEDDDGSSTSSSGGSDLSLYSLSTVNNNNNNNNNTLSLCSALTTVDPAAVPTRQIRTTKSKGCRSSFNFTRRRAKDLVRAAANKARRTKKTAP